MGTLHANLGRNFLYLICISCAKRISGLECIAFSRAFRKSKAIKCVFLCGNPITQQHIKQILILIRGTNSLNILSFGERTRLIKENADIASKIMEKFPALQIIYDDTILNRSTKVVDFTAILIDRCRYLCMKSKNLKLTKDLGHFFLKILDDATPYCTQDEFCKLLLGFNNKLEASIGEQIAVDWLESAGKGSKSQRVAIHKMAKYYLERYPTERPIPPVLKPNGSANGETKATE